MGRRLLTPLTVRAADATSCQHGQDRIPVILLLRQHGPNRAGHLVGQRDRHQHARLTHKHSRHPGALHERLAACPTHTRHSAHNQQPSNIGLASLRDAAKSFLAAG